MRADNSANADQSARLARFRESRLEQYYAIANSPPDLKNRGV